MLQPRGSMLQPRGSMLQPRGSMLQPRVSMFQLGCCECVTYHKDGEVEQSDRGDNEHQSVPVVPLSHCCPHVPGDRGRKVNSMGGLLLSGLHRPGYIGASSKCPGTLAYLMKYLALYDY